MVANNKRERGDEDVGGPKMGKICKLDQGNNITIVDRVGHGSSVMPSG